MRRSSRLTRSLGAHHCWRRDRLQQWLSQLPWAMAMVAPRLEFISECSILKVTARLSLEVGTPIITIAVEAHFQIRDQF